MLRFLFAALFLVFQLALDFPTLAEPIEIHVTANAIEQDLARSISSTTEVSSDRISENHSEHMQDLTLAVPNLNWSAGSNRARFFQIRGIGELEQYQGAPNPSVAFLIDDFDLSSLGSVATLFDVEKVTVLRGPQGFGYGPSGLAGLVQLKTKEPTPYFNAQGETSLGTDDLWSVGAAISGPLLQDSTALQYRLSALQSHSNGFLDNEFLNEHNSNQRNEVATRAKLRWLANHMTTFDLQLMHLEANNGYDAFAIDNGFSTQSDRPGSDDQRTQGAALKATFDINTRSSLVASATMLRSNTDYSYDGDWGNNPYWGNYAPYDYFSRTLRTRHSASHELRFLSTPHSDLLGEEWNWLLGLYQQRLTESSGETQYQDNFPYDQLDGRYSSHINAAFGALDVPIISGSALTLGIRGESRVSDYKDSRAVNFDSDEGLYGFIIGLKQRISDSSVATFSVSRGYKGGGVNTAIAVPANKLTYGAEKLINFEAGIAAAGLSDRLNTKLNLFHSLRRDQQVKYALQNDPNDPLSFTYLTDNAARGHNQGLEIETSWKMSERITAFTNASLLRTRFDDYPTGTRNLKGREQSHAPNWQHNTGVRINFSEAWFLRTEISGRDAFYFDDSHDQRSSSYHILNATLGFQQQHWSWSLWAHNIFDRRYAVRGFYFGLEPPDYPSKEYVQLGDPMQIGTTLRINF